MAAFVPHIDYREHPAFVGLAFDNPEAATTSALIVEADAAYLSGRDEVKHPNAKFADVLQRRVVGPVRRVFEHILRTTPNPDGFDKFINQIYQRLVSRMEAEYRLAERQGAYCWRPETDRSAHWLSQLRSQGYFMGHFDTDALRGLFDRTAPYRKVIEDNMRNGMTSRGALSTNNLDQDTYAPFARLINHPDIVTAVSNFMGQLTACTGFAFELSVSHSRWWKGRYGGADYESMPAAYYHVDEGADSLKMLLYLGEVKRDGGPFSIIPAGWPWDPSPLRSAMCRVIDSIGHLVRYDDMSHDEADHLHTLASPTGRRHFMRLPPEFQCVSHWGNDVLSGSPLEREVVDNELRVTSDVANFVVFHGSSLFHRGGVVDNPDARRWGCQVILNPI